MLGARSEETDDEPSRVTRILTGKNHKKQFAFFVLIAVFCFCSILYTSYDVTTIKNEEHFKKKVVYDGDRNVTMPLIDLEEEEKAKKRRQIYFNSFPSTDHDQIKTFSDLHSRLYVHQLNNTTNTSSLPMPNNSSLPSVINDIPRPRNLNILFLGDSLTRYQYLDLAYFLAYGSWVDPTNHSLPSMVNEKPYLGDWLSFYNDTNTALQPYEQCDCFRKSGNIGNGQGVIENRYFRDEERNNTVTYLQKFGSFPVRSSWNVSDVHNPHEPMPVTLSQFKPILEMGWIEAIKDFVCKMQPKPSVFIFNEGMWRNNDLVNETIQADIFDALESCHIPVTIYKTTTRRWKETGRKIAEYESQLCARADHCLNIAWTGLVPKDIYWDPAHFFPPIYTWMNLHLLSLLSTIETVPI